MRSLHIYLRGIELLFLFKLGFSASSPLRLLDLEYQTPSIALPSPCSTLKDETRRARMKDHAIQHHAKGRRQRVGLLKLPLHRPSSTASGEINVGKEWTSTCSTTCCEHCPSLYGNYSSFNPYSTVVRYIKEQRLALQFFCINLSLISTYIQRRPLLNLPFESFNYCLTICQNRSRLRDAYALNRWPRCWSSCLSQYRS